MVTIIFKSPESKQIFEEEISVLPEDEQNILRKQFEKYVQFGENIKIRFSLNKPPEIVI